MDYRKWVQQAIEFQSRLGNRPGEWEVETHVRSPLEQYQIEKLNNKLRHSIPECVAAFLAGGSAGMRNHYCWTPETKKEAKQLSELIPETNYIYGGADLCNAKKFKKFQKECVEIAEETWIDDEPELKEMWLNSFPFARLANADMIALDLRKDMLDPPVVYLSHDDDSRLISESFDRYLEDWAAASYVGPEIWVLKAFFDAESKMLTPNKQHAAEFRQLLTGVE